MDLVLFVTVIATVVVAVWAVIIYYRPCYPSSGSFTFVYSPEAIHTTHLRTTAQLGSRTARAILDTGYGDDVTVTESVLHAFDQGVTGEAPPSAASAMTEAEREQIMRSSGITVAGTAKRTMQALVTTKETVGSIGYAPLKLIRDGTLQQVEDYPTSTRIVTTFTGSSLPMILTMPYLVQRAPVAMKFGGLAKRNGESCSGRSAVDGKMTLTFGARAPHSAVKPAQFHTGGVVAITCVVSPAGGKDTTVNLIFDTGFSGFISINQSVVDDMGACGSLDTKTITQKDVFNHSTCTAIFTADVSLVTDQGRVQIGTAAPIYATDSDMPSSVHGLIGLAAMQSMDWYIHRSALLRMPALYATSTCVASDGATLLSASLDHMSTRNMCKSSMEKACKVR